MRAGKRLTLMASVLALGCIVGAILLSSCGRPEGPSLRIRSVNVSPSQVPFDGGTVNITALVLGGPVRYAVAEISPWGERLTLRQTSVDIYSGTYEVPPNTSTSPVTCTVTVIVEDVFGNRASKKTTFILLGPEAPPSPPS